MNASKVEPIDEAARLEAEEPALPLDPTKPMMVVEYPEAEVKFLAMINSAFPMIVVVTYPGAYDIVYHVGLPDGIGFSYFEKKAITIANKEDEKASERD